MPEYFLLAQPNEKILAAGGNVPPLRGLTVQRFAGEIFLGKLNRGRVAPTVNADKYGLVFASPKECDMSYAGIRQRDKITVCKAGMLPANFAQCAIERDKLLIG